MKPPEATSPGESLRLECPRCGQLLGVMADEAERHGETRGICSECGLDVEWRRLRTEGVAPAWFVEARCSPRSIVRRAFGTLARTARPFRFWASLDLALPISVRGLVAFIALLCLLSHLTMAMVRLTIHSPAGPMPTLPNSVESAPAIGKVALALLWPAETLDGAEIVAAAHFTSVETELLPLLGRSASLALAAFLAPRGGDARWLRSGLGIAECRPLFPSGFLAPAVLGVLVAGLTPLVMLLIPISLRRARVRQRHFVRMLALGLVMPLAVLLGTLAATQALHALGLIVPQNPHHHLHLLGEFRDPYFSFAVLFVAGLLGAVWTAAAASRYLRMPNARAVGICCGAISALTAALALVLL